MLLIDEIDRADEEFEAFLFELLAESSVTIPEIGTLHAKQPAHRDPHVEPHARPARRPQRRCLYHWIDYPPLARRRSRSMRGTRARGVGRPRHRDRVGGGAAAQPRRAKPPGVAEAIDWVHAANLLGLDHLDEDGVELTLGSVLKHREGPRGRARRRAALDRRPARALKRATDDAGG